MSTPLQALRSRPDTLVISDRDTENIALVCDEAPVIFPVRELWRTIGSPLTEIDPYTVWTIRKLHIIQGVSAKAVARRFGISRRTVFRICSGESHAYVAFPNHRGEPITYDEWLDSPVLPGPAHRSTFDPQRAAPESFAQLARNSFTHVALEVTP